jgi:hypothetical protein
MHWMIRICNMKMNTPRAKRRAVGSVMQILCTLSTSLFLRITFSMDYTYYLVCMYVHVQNRLHFLKIINHAQLLHIYLYTSADTCICISIIMPMPIEQQLHYLCVIFICMISVKWKVHFWRREAFQNLEYILKKHSLIAV